MDRSLINNSTKCWEFQGSKDRNGYGLIAYDGKVRLVHRLAYMYFNNASLEDIAEKVVMHKCDNPCCVNPKHLMLGTQSDNIHDMHRKGRGPNIRGENNGNSKLTDYQAKKIKQLYDIGLSQEELSKMFNVSRRTVYNIRTGATWGHLFSE